MNKLYSRREFLKAAFKNIVAVSFGASLINNRLFSKASGSLFAEPAAKDYDLYVIEGTNYGKLIRDGFDCIGGISKFVKKGSYVVLKPNAAWERKPEEAATTHPELITETIKLCLEAGARKVDVIENACDNWKNTFKISGIGDAVKKAGGNMVALNETGMFTEVTIPKAKTLKTARIASQVLSADCFINMPIAKNHGSATLTMAMKNHMGIVEDRSFFHVNGLHQCIADIGSYITPAINILDCTRILLTRGPKGPGEVKVLNKIIIGKDQVAVDSMGAALFGLKPHDIGYIKIAGEMGLGKTNVEDFKILTK